MSLVLFKGFKTVYAQRLLLVLFSGMTLADAQGTSESAEGQIWVGHV